MKPFTPPQYSKRFWFLLLLVSLFFFIPGGIIGPIWSFDAYAQVAQRAPVVRFNAGLIGTVIFLPLGIIFAIVSALSLLKQPALQERFRSTIGERLALASLAVGVVILVTAPIAARIVLPQYGYSICHKLVGGMSIYHNDWVQNPEWCVRGKTHEWVNAMAARAAGADIDPDNLPPAPGSSEPTSTGGMLWMAVGLLLGAGFWFNHLRHHRQHGTVRRWLTALAGGAGAGFLSSIMTLGAFEISGGRHWVALLVLAVVLTYPLNGMYDRRQQP